MKTCGQTYVLKEITSFRNSVTHSCKSYQGSDCDMFFSPLCFYILLHYTSSAVLMQWEEAFKMADDNEIVQGMVWKCAKYSAFSCDNSFDEYLNETVNLLMGGSSSCSLAIY